MAEELPPYGDRLLAALGQRGLSRRKFAPLLAHRWGTTEETEARAIKRYINDGEEPTQEKAAVIAVLLDAPELALVQPMTDRRAARRAELEARVAAIEEAMNELGPQLEAMASQLTELRQQVPSRTRPGG